MLARSLGLGPATFAQSPPPPNPIADTLIDPRGLDNIRARIEDVLENDVRGDVIEAGGDTSRSVWVADSFRGLPSPEESDTQRMSERSGGRISTG
jgi:hypothetical protein